MFSFFYFFSAADWLRSVIARQYSRYSNIEDNSILRFDAFLIFIHRPKKIDRQTTEHDRFDLAWEFVITNSRGSSSAAAAESDRGKNLNDRPKNNKTRESDDSVSHNRN